MPDGRNYSDQIANTDGWSGRAVPDAKPVMVAGRGRVRIESQMGAMLAECVPRKYVISLRAVDSPPQLIGTDAPVFLVTDTDNVQLCDWGRGGALGGSR
jgi:hypothetical protein